MDHKLTNYKFRSVKNNYEKTVFVVSIPMFNINRRLLLMKLCFFIFDFGSAPIVPFIPTVLTQRGVSLVVVGSILTFVPVLNIVIRPLVGYVTDRWHCCRSVFLCASLINAIVTPTLHFIPDFLTDQQKAEEVNVLESWKFWVFLLVITVNRIMWMIGDVLQDTICVNILGKESSKYSVQRIFGTIGWGISSVLAGWCVDWYSQGEIEKNHLPVYLIISATMIIHVLAASQLEIKTVDKGNTNKGAVRKVLSDFKTVSFLVWVTFAGIFTAYTWYYIFIYIEDLANIFHPERLPWIKTIEGLSFTVQCCLGEMPIFLFFGIILKRTGHMVAFSISFAMFALRFYLYSIVEDPLWILPIELLTGVSFAMAFLSGISYAAKLAPPGSEGTMQGLFGMAFQGLGVSSGGFIAGYTFKTLGSSYSYRFISYVAFVVFIVQVLISQLLQRRKNKSSKRMSDKCGSIHEMENLQNNEC
ncbi:nucleoside permease NupG-like isoform X2 [Adelges cooleyi]|uniref:nucleoside permease NupG-like isoform X2 n=1 Tax=Adelges cooleyi TaxID=133065 RepID=UPI00217F9123|nr:nucleoside permease NupG-like isoform X2 [Adelges cooleyi]XP_050437376.1 nucleoside permease NupG-like isoform X2 [Adelges cooleyi]XP_050437382.1 nucleoside permease NupG-like isoform X2 [Adelges cooleyi]XP_050437390.1 nucleoside permease NupG-like isoform X2 [Adelges cooleyi]XP_050437399.1 nucleoside permease NupG-like isoform X2 [Adelges cooleyi]